MKIILHTDSVDKLSQSIKNKISKDLPTWEIKLDDKKFTMYFHSTKSGQWEDNLFVKPFKNSDENQLIFYITKSDGKKIDFEPSFGYLMGRFIEILIVHFSDKYDKLEVR
ncbi:hypothetical protein Q73A0000_06615 [Kaistella flava (ex Peng et al. 2021)]|uniref:Uncharacterized protein n=1 Tax=Kaistella flava (ex Peng et al. 2021) TaxID=2038776 RepID=A0A7M2Y726_9FLAO|nr:hypothetical protein [Kaistella flava (ex Peng et al. 2021)]QOW10058.1 hypothetical protein Q73A0000_06615 [Kaistella flava (ex Peng et al. 2021)]